MQLWSKIKLYAVPCKTIAIFLVSIQGLLACSVAFAFNQKITPTEPWVNGPGDYSFARPAGCTFAPDNEKLVNVNPEPIGAYLTDWMNAACTSVSACQTMSTGADGACYDATPVGSQIGSIYCPFRKKISGCGNFEDTGEHVVSKNCAKFGPKATYDPVVRDCVCIENRVWVPSVGQCLQVAPALLEVVDERSCSVSNPTLAGTGRKIHEEKDYPESHGFPIGITRHYRSAWTDGAATLGLASVPPFSAGWRLSVHAGLSLLSGNAIRAFRPDGSTIEFLPSSRAATSWLATNSRDTLTAIMDASGQRVGFKYIAAADDSTETYGVTGKLQSIRQRNGLSTTLSYDADGRLSSVRSPFGRETQFSYDAQGRLVELLPPGAVAGAAAGSATSPIRYAYEEAASLGIGTPPQNQLTSVTWQDGRIKRYHYEDARFPGALTGITDEAGVRYATYAYDAQGRVSHTEHVGGADRVDFAYGFDPAGKQTTQVTDYSGANGGAATRTYTFENAQGVLRPASITAPCPLCGNTQQSYTYDATGNTTKTIAHDGSVTFYAYDAKGRETERAVFSSSYQSATTRPALSAATSVTSTQWHATWKLPLQVAEPGKLSSYTYDSQGNLTGQSWSATTDSTGRLKFSAAKTGSTYATGWGYNANSLVTSIVEKTDATETGRWTLGYNAVGDVTSVSDVKRNRMATIGNLDAHGNYLELTDFDGVKRAQKISPRGFLSSVKYGAQETTYQLNPIGLISTVTNPFGAVTEYVYDANHRLIDVKINGQSVASLDSPSAILAALDRVVSMLVSQANAQSSTANGAGVWGPTRPASPMDWLLPGRAIAEANRNLAIQLQRLIDRCIPKEEKRLHRGRIQFQGTDYSGTSGSGDSESWAQAEPPTAADVLAMLDRLEARMTATQYKNRSVAIAQARKYIASRAPTGISAPFSKTWMNPGMSNERVDLEVIEGVAFKN